MDAQATLRHWSAVRQGLEELLGRFSDDELDFVPQAGLWSVQETALHIANAEDGWFRYIVQRQITDWPPVPNLAEYPTVASIKQYLTETHSSTETIYAGATPDDLNRLIDLPWSETAKMSLADIIWHILEHEIHHRGELSLMLGLLGKEGPDV